MDIKPLNKQLYENSGLKELFDKSCGEGGDPLALFFNGKDPNLAILHEKPEHRLLLYMKAQGASNKEIAEQSGYTQPWLSQLFRQPWAQQRLIEIMNQCGKDRVTTLIASAAEDSVLTLIELRDDPESPAAVRRSAAENLLDRYLGKPKQQVDVVQKGTSAEDVQEIDRELELLTAEENRLKGTTV